MLEKQLWLPGEQCEREEVCRVAREALAGAQPRREYRATIAANNTLEATCSTKLSALTQDKRMWQHMPASALVASKTNLTFRMVSRAKCSVHQLLIAEHMKWHTRIFKLLYDYSIVDELRKPHMCVGVLGAFVVNFLESFGEDLTSGDAKCYLEASVVFIKHDIAQIEATHASIRRVLLARSHNTHPMRMQNLSREWVLQRSRRLAFRMRGGIFGQSSKKSNTNDAQREPETRGTKRKRGGGGAARQSVSDQLRLRGLRLRDAGVAGVLHREYKEMSGRGRRERLAALGKEATLRWREVGRRGHLSAFGFAPTRKRKRAAEQKLRVALWQRHRNLPASQQALAKADSLHRVNPLSHEDMPRALIASRAQAYLERQVRKGEQEAAEAHLEAWQSAIGDEKFK